MFQLSFQILILFSIIVLQCRLVIYMVLQSGSSESIYTQYFTDEIKDYIDRFSFDIEGETQIPVNICVGCYLNEDHYVAVSDI